MHPPTLFRGFTDFCVGIHHAIRCGEIINGPHYQLPLNYHYIPTAYNARASTVLVSGTELRRPLGLRKRLDQDPLPTFGPSAWFDFELEMGFFVGLGNRTGEPISISDAAAHVTGICLLHYWSARAIPMFYMAPLGTSTDKRSGP